ncbi:unnamed protein product [marine sediment metagenome]|uniref:Uncharacterized protein n=1 Tax=marine sediment metagenome TaxID=412755 RepID=X0SZS0_9ZZZZ
MATKQIEASGSLVITNNGQNTKPIALGTGGDSQRSYEEVVTDQTVVNTAGGVAGGVFQDLPCVSGLSEVQFLYLKSDNAFVLRLYAVPASAISTTGAYPTTFGGGETLITTIDGVAVTATFLIGDQTVDQVVARINAAMALAGIATPRASAVAGQLRIDGVATAVGAGGIGQLTFAGTGSVQLGMDAATIVDAQGQDQTLAGLTIMEFPHSGQTAPTAAQVSGTATIDVVAAGRA